MTKEQKEKALAFLKDMQECTYDGVEEIRTVIEALEQQPCEDCVDRNHVIATISQHHFDKDKDNFDLLIHNLCKEVNELPSVTPTQSWILIKRRDLTQEEKELYSSFYGFEPEYMIESRMPDDGEEVLVSAGGIVFKDNFSRDDFDFENISIDEIDAWMPLPQPYEDKGGNK